MCYTLPDAGSDPSEAPFTRAHALSGWGVCRVSGQHGLTLSRTQDYASRVRQRSEDENRALVTAARLSSLGLYMGLCIGLCSYLGLLADQRWSLAPLGTILGFVLGTAAAFYGLVREISRVSSKR